MVTCVWVGRLLRGPGETPELKGLIYPDTAIISGSAVGFKQTAGWFDLAQIRG
jgi:hypothetical protein